MVQLRILNGKMAGTETSARHFPFRLGRSPRADLPLEGDGIWDEHLVMAFDPAQGFILSTQTEAIAAINGEPFQRAVLRNGDVIEIGALKLRFWLGETRQSGLQFWESLAWAAFLLITAGQLALIYRIIF